MTPSHAVWSPRAKPARGFAMQCRRPNDAFGGMRRSAVLWMCGYRPGGGGRDRGGLSGLETLQDGHGIPAPPHTQAFPCQQPKYFKYRYFPGRDWSPQTAKDSHPAVRCKKHLRRPGVVGSEPLRLSPGLVAGAPYSNGVSAMLRRSLSFMLTGLLFRADLVDRLRGPDRLVAEQDRADRRGDGGERRHHDSDRRTRPR